jgi:hypothetical protein
MADDQPGTVTVEIKWPDDSYADATPANAFILTELNEVVCVALAFVPPPPHLLDGSPGDRRAVIEATRPTAFAVPRSTLASLYIELGKFIARNPQSYGFEEGFGAADNADKPA